MSNKRRTLQTLIGALLVLLILVTTYLAQSNNASQNQNTQAVLKEKGNEDRVRNNAASVLARRGLKLGSPLARADAASHRQLQIHMRSFGKSDSGPLLRTDQVAASAALTRTSSTVRSGAIPRERSFELAPDRILVTGLDDADSVRWWRIIVDPRLVRAEVGSSSEKQSQIYYQPDVELALECPDDLALKQLRFYRPVWNGQEFDLELIGALALE